MASGIRSLVSLKVMQLKKTNLKVFFKGEAVMISTDKPILCDAMNVKDELKNPDYVVW